MQAVAIRYINIGEEITVSYGSHYFSENNYEYLYTTYASLQRNGWIINNKEIKISASLATEDDEEYPTLRTAKIKRRRNRKFRIRPYNIRILHCAVYRLNNLIYLRCKRYLKLYGR
jgi:hypothetical protein